MLVLAPLCATAAAARREDAMRACAAADEALILRARLLSIFDALPMLTRVCEPTIAAFSQSDHHTPPPISSSITEPPHNPYAAARRGSHAKEAGGAKDAPPVKH